MQGLQLTLSCLIQVLNKQAVDVVCSTYEMVVADSSGFGSRWACFVCMQFSACALLLALSRLLFSAEKVLAMLTLQRDEVKAKSEM
jgi:hypothetical protein